MVSFEIAGHPRSFAVLLAHANVDGSIRMLTNNQPHNGFTYCMACSSFMWPLRPPPALIPPSKDIKGKAWNAADITMRGMAAHQAAAAHRGGGRTSGDGGGHTSGGGRFGGVGGSRRASSSSGSNTGKRGSSDGETSRGQVLPRLAPLPAACISGPEPSSDVADHEFFNGLGGWMPVASGSSQLANIRTHVSSQKHDLSMQALRLLARSGAGHFNWLPKPIAGVRLCPYLVPEAERLRVLDSKEAAAASAAAAALPGTVDLGAAVATMAGEMEGEIDADMEGMDPPPQGVEGPEEREVGSHSKDARGVPHGWVCCPVCYHEHLIEECCLCDEDKRKGGCYKCIVGGNPEELLIRCREHRERYEFSMSI